MQFDAIWNDVLGLGAAEKSLNIIRTLNGAFWRYLKRCFGSLNCWKKMGTLNGAFWRYLKRCFGSWNSCENFEVNDANWSVLILFKTLLFFLKLELLRKNDNTAVLCSVLMQFESLFWKLELQRKCWKQRPLLAHSNPIWNDVMFSWNCLKKMENNEA